jgi:hypothetical protein
MSNQKKIIKLTNSDGSEYLLGVDSIIEIHWIEPKGMSKISSREAMVTTNWAMQTPEEIWMQINN